MEPPKAISPRAFWGGIAIGVAFRTFAYSLLYGASLLGNIPGLPPLMERAVGVVYWILTLAILPAVFWVPYAAGFLSAYYWGDMEAGDYVRAIWLSAIGFCLVVVAMSFVAEISPMFCFSVVFIGLDVGMCGRGADRGILFWNSRQGRQFLGDFSTDEWKNEGH